MIHLNRCSRVGGSGIKTRRGAPHRTLVVALAASFAVLAIGGAGSIAPTDTAFAQTPGTAGPITFNLFTTGDSVDLEPGAAQRLADAARRAQAPGDCPLGRLTINTQAGDRLFQEALGAARRDAVLAFLDRQGIKANRFFADVVVSGTQNNVRLDLNVSRDNIPPALDVTWTPPKGTKVRVGTRITAKAVVRDDANLWQTGIKTIDLDVQGGGSFGFEDFPRPPQTCESTPPPRTLEGVYTVPSNPPPIVRLRAVAKDFAGHSAEDIAEFPTGDWYGTFGWTTVCDGPPGFGGKIRGVGDLALDYDGNGNLTGTLAGTTPEGLSIAPRCSAKVLAPGTFSAKLVGSYTPGSGTMSARAVDVQITPGRELVSCPFGSGEKPAPAYPGYQTPMLQNAFRDLRPEPDGSLKSKGEQTIGLGGSSCTTTYSLTLRQAQN